MSDGGGNSALAAADRLRRVAETMEGVDADWLRDGLRAYLEDAHAGLTLEHALGLSCGPGGTPWWRLERIRARDEALRVAAAMLAPDDELSEQAERVLSEWRAYRRAAWRHDRTADDVPPRIAGTAREALWRAGRAAPLPDSVRQLRRLLESGT